MGINICKKGDSMEQGGLMWNKFEGEQIKAKPSGCREHVRCDSIFV